MGTQVNPQTPTVVSWNYSIEQQLARNTSLRVGYVGSHGIIDIDADTIPQQICSDPAGCLAGASALPEFWYPRERRIFRGRRGPIRIWPMPISGIWRALAVTMRSKPT
jgi:hypothetical protein